jgi:hypothetical protein
MVIESTRKKRFMIEAFLYSASLPCDNDNRARLKHAITGRYLQAVVLELIIKTLYELDHHREASFTHNLLSIYNDLESSTRLFFEDRFNESLDRSRRSPLGKEVDFHKLEDVLRLNSDVVRNFKYDAKGINCNSSADGMFYNEMLAYIDKRGGS